LLEKDRATTREECELLEMLEDLEEDDLAFISQVNREILRRVEEMPESLTKAERKAAPLGLDITPPTEKPQDFKGGKCPDSMGMPRLFLLGSVRPTIDYGSFPGAMGLVPPAAQVGDYICQVHSLKKAIVVRRTENLLEIVGTTGLALNCQKGQATRTDKHFPKFSQADFSCLTSGDTLDLLVDMPFSYSLMDSDGITQGASERSLVLSFPNIQESHSHSTSSRFYLKLQHTTFVVRRMQL
jgi:hypothetical protein